MKNLFLVLALLILGSFVSQGAFAISAGTANSAAATGGYPACYQGYGVGDPLYNGTNEDKFDTGGWCIDDYGVLQPKKSTVDSSHPNTQGGWAVPVLNVNVGGINLVNGTPTVTMSTYDALIAQQTGTTIVDYGGFSTTPTIDTLKGSGGHYVLPPAQPGEIFTIVSASQSVITIDTLTPAFAATEGLTYAVADTIDFSPSGVGMTAGQSLKSPGNSGAMITLTSNVAGQWQITNMQGQIGSNTTSDSLWTVISTQ